MRIGVAGRVDISSGALARSKLAEKLHIHHLDRSGAIAEGVGIGSKTYAVAGQRTGRCKPRTVASPRIAVELAGPGQRRGVRSPLQLGIGGRGAAKIK